MEEEEEGEGENSKETDMDDDEAEIENILLGYTKTPATANAKKALKSEAVRNAASSVVVEIPISTFIFTFSLCS